MTDTTSSQNDLPQRLRIVSNMIHMGEKIQWGEETYLMDAAANEIVRLRELLEWEYMTPGMKLAVWVEALWKKWRRK